MIEIKKDGSDPMLLYLGDKANECSTHMEINLAFHQVGKFIATRGSKFALNVIFMLFPLAATIFGLYKYCNEGKESDAFTSV